MRWALLFLVACGPGDYDCVTTDGVYLSGSSDCDGLHTHLVRTERAFRAQGLTPPSLEGWTVKVHWGPESQGYVNPGCIVVSTDVWHASALSHEVAHTVDGFATPGHEGWDVDGRNEAITRVNHPGPVFYGGEQ